MEYKQERFTLNKLCEFGSRETEAEFMEYEKGASANTARFLIFFMGFAFCLFSVSDFYFHGKSAAFFASLGLRLAGFFVMLTAFFLSGKFKTHRQTLAAISLAELLVFGIYLVILYIRKSRDLPLQFMTVMLFILAVFLVPNKWKNCLVSGCVIWAAYIIYSFFFTGISGSPSLVQRGVCLAVCLVSCAALIYGREKSRRRQFSSEKLLEFISITDRLTGIYNRGRFEFILGQWIKSMRHFPFCLLFFDIDNFKKVNDLYGHIAGDRALVNIVQIVSSNIRDDDIFARWGGEEFVILFGSTGIERAAELAERLRKAVEEENAGDAPGKITISIGVVQYRNGETVSTLIDRADAKMFEAKRSGKNKVIAEIVKTDRENTAAE